VPMRALLDFTQIPKDRTGVGVYAENLVKELVHHFKAPDILFLLVQKDEQRIRQIVKGCSNVVIISLPTTLFRNRALLLFFEQLIMPFLLMRRQIDVVHSLHYTHPLFSPCSRVVTIHDLTHLLFPELHTTGRRLVMAFFGRHAVRHAEGVLFISNATCVDAEKLIPTVNENFRRVVPHGVDPQEFQISRELTKKVLDGLSITKPFLLFIGTLEPRKNIVRLIQAFERVAGEFPDFILVIAGKPGWGFDEIFTAMRTGEHRNRIRYLGFVTEVEKKALLSECEELIYPSLYEGFGLPVLEAMAMGAPVITSNISSLPEVTGEAAVLIDPFSVDDMTAAIRDMANSATRRRELSALGKQRASTFSWEKTAKQTFDLYKVVAKD